MTDPNDPDETDEFPGCGGSVDTQTGDLTIVNEDMVVEETYRRGEWVGFETYAD